MQEIELQQARDVATSVPGRAHALIPAGNVPAVPPPAADDDALAVLWECRGDRLATELVDALAWLRARLAELARTVVGGDLTAARTVAELATLHNSYAARLMAVRRLSGQDGEPIAPIAIAGLMGHLATHAGPDGATQVRARIAATIARARRDLDLVETELESLRRTAGDDDAYLLAFAPHAMTERGVQDTLLARLADLLGRRRALESRISLLEQDQAATTRIVADRVQAAVQAAGGAARVAESIVAARVLAEPPLAEPRDMASVRMSLGQLATAGIAAGTAYDDLTARLATLETEHSARLAEAAQHRRPEADDLVKRGLVGDESARAEIEAMTAASRAFSPGFHQVIAEARFDRAALAELAHALA